MQVLTSVFVTCNLYKKSEQPVVPSDAVDSGRSATYTYDALSRLTSAVTTGSTGYAKWGISEIYDRFGNRSDQNQTFGNPPMNHITIDAATNRISGYCYDLNGNLLAESAAPCPSPTYTYDAENRLVNYMSTNPTYVYDGNGLRVKKCAPNCSSPTTTTVYIFSGSKVIAEYDNSAAPSAPSREYIYGGAALLAKIAGSTSTYYHQDHLSNRMVTDSTGNTLAQMGHYPFGESWYNSTGDKLLFTTYERDTESGNDYAMARYDISRFGRFGSPDPLGGFLVNPQSLNRYPYTQNDPVNGVDPTGMVRRPCSDPDDPCIQNFAGGGGGGPTCTADGVDLPCNIVMNMLRNGFGVLCPNNDCSGVRYYYDPNGNGNPIFQQWVQRASVQTNILKFIGFGPDGTLIYTVVQEGDQDKYQGYWIDVPGTTTDGNSNPLMPLVAGIGGSRLFGTNNAAQTFRSWATRGAQKVTQTVVKEEAGAAKNLEWIDEQMKQLFESGADLGHLIIDGLSGFNVNISIPVYIDPCAPNGKFSPVFGGCVQFD